MKKANILIMVTIAVTFTVLFAAGGLTLKTSDIQSYVEQTQIFSGNFINVTGMLLMTPDEETMITWQREIEK